MTAQLFKLFAPAFFAKGISVIPLQPYNSPMTSAGKRPIPYNWTYWNDKPIPASVQQDWLERYPNANLGIAAGPQSNIIFLDVDSTDARIKDIFTRVLPSSPWIRIGQKGFVMAYRYSNYISSFKIKGEDGVAIIECLSKGNQAVIPPSIHPKTQQPYSENVPLLSVIDHLPVLPAELETILRGALEEAGFVLSHSGYSKMTDWVPAGARDNKMTSMAGMFARDVSYGRITLQEAIDQMKTWQENLVEKVSGDDIDINKGMWKVVEFLQRDVTGKRKKPLPIGWDKNLEPNLKAECDKIFTREHEEWTALELKTYAHRNFEQNSGDDAERMNCVNTVLEKIARSPSLSNLDKEMIYAYIHQTSRLPGMTISNLRKRVREIQQGEISGANHTEIAEAVVKRMEADSGEMRNHGGYFWQWKGAQWEKVSEGEIMRTIAEEFGDLETAKRYADHKGIMQVMRVLVSTDPIASPINGVNFANGFLAVTQTPKGEWQLKLMPHAPNLGATSTLPYRYVQEQGFWEKMPRFAQLLHDCWSHDPDYGEKVLALQEMIGATLFGMGTAIQRCCILYGAANSGKSTVLHVIKGLFNRDAVSTCPPEQWGDKFAPATMSDKLLNIAGELSEKKLIDGKVFKEIIDGMEITAQFKNQQLFQFEPKATHWFASNYLPKTTDSSEGFTRRLLLLWFRKPISVEKKIIGLHNQIIWNEREAIAAWAASAVPRLCEQKEPTLPASHEQLINDLAAENNSVRFFFQRCSRVLTVKKVRQMLKAAQAVNTVPTAPTTPVVQVQNYGKPSAGIRGTIVPKAMVATPEIFKEWSSENLILEDILFGEYISFCQSMGGVKPVGVRVFRARVREMEYEHSFEIMGSTDSEVLSYKGLVIGMIE